MEHIIEISAPKDGDDVKGAESVFKGFFVLYEPTLSKLDLHLGDIIEKIGATYAEAYMPWHAALHDLCVGVLLVTKKIPLPDTERFIEALKIFSFEGAIQFLYDLCLSCRIAIERDWAKKFHAHIHMLLFSFDVMQRQHQHALSR